MRDRSRSSVTLDVFPLKRTTTTKQGGYSGADSSDVGKLAGPEPSGKGGRGKGKQRESYFEQIGRSNKGDGKEKEPGITASERHVPYPFVFDLSIVATYNLTTKTELSTEKMLRAWADVFEEHADDEGRLLEKSKQDGSNFWVTGGMGLGGSAHASS